MKYVFLSILALVCCSSVTAQRKPGASKPAAVASLDSTTEAALSRSMHWRPIGPFRGGRSVAAAGVIQNNQVYYMGTTGGGVWKTEDAGQTWFNISDGYFKTGSVGAVEVAESDPNVIYVGMGEHAPRGVMTSYGDGVYKSTDAGKTWSHLGLELTRHISRIALHPQQPDVLLVGAQGALHGPSKERGVYKSNDGGKTWRNVLYVDENTGCSDLVMDMTNPRILYAAMWDHRRTPWQVISGGKGSGLYKSNDGGETWKKIEKGLPAELGKMGISVCRSNPEKLYALVESDTQKELGGLFVSENAGESWSRISKDHRLTQRAWYYIEVFADPQNENTVYVLNSPGLKSTDGGRTWTNIRGTHGDYHHLWINPNNSQNMIVANDGGAAVSFNGGKVWSTQSNQPTAQFYRVNADHLFPYHLYAGQQDNSSVKIASRSTSGYSITDNDWTSSAGGESAFLAFNPDDPQYVVGGSYQGTIEVLDTKSGEGTNVMIAPIQYQALQPKQMKYRFNWNAPIVWSKYEPQTFYHAGNHLFKTKDMGRSWEIVSPDLTRNDSTKQGISGLPYTNEGAGGENYGTISYVIESQHEKGVIWTGSDDGLVHVTRDGGKKWDNVTPAGLEECLINCIEVSPHEKGTVYIAATRYKFNDFAPALYVSRDYGASWKKIVNGIPYGAYTRAIREDNERKGLLYCGTETGFFVSFNDGEQWMRLQLGLPIVPITDLKVHQGDLLASTMGRSFWILDDIHVLRQYNPIAAPTQLQFFQPENPVRLSRGSMMDRMNEFGAMPLSGGTGFNAPSGVVLHYFIPETLEGKEAMTLEITNDKGELVNRFTAKPNPSFVAYPGGPSADPLIGTKAGINRFVWNLRYPTLPGVPNVFIEGSYDGHKASPGKYTATLRSEKTSTSIFFTILPDPRIKATDAEYAAQHALATKVENDIRDIHLSVLKMRKVKQQINALLDLWKDKKEMNSLSNQGKQIVNTINDWENELVQNKAQSNDDIINYVNKLSADYIFLKGEMDTNIPLVTKGQEQQYEALHQTWMIWKKQMLQLLEKDVTAFNAASNEMKVPAISMPE